MRFLSILLITFAICANTAVAAEFGYSNGEVGRSKSTVFRLGTETRQGAAIRISSNKLESLDGHQISTVSAGFGTRNVEAGSMYLFIAHDLNADPVYVQSISFDRALQWYDFALETPFTINAADGDLYIGYYGDLPSNASLLIGDKTNTSPEMIYGIYDNKWVDLHNSGYGNPAIKFTVADAPAVTDIILHPVDFSVYMSAGEEYDFTGTLYNYGTEPIKDFDLAITIGNGEPQTSHVEGVNIAQCGSLDFNLPTLSSDTEGQKNIKVVVSNINGVSDADASDNSFDMAAYFYPENMERNILLEGFTGMACGNCPTGHSTINSFLAANPELPVIEIMHHSGYQADLLTTDCTNDFTYLYGGSTYAPAIMVNRTAVPELSSVPVVNTTLANLSKAFTYALQQEPYVSMSLETEFDEDTRVLKMRLKSYVHNDLPSERNTINILLIQDNMTNDNFYQSGAGTGYVHRHVTRDAPMGNSWGYEIGADKAKAGAEIVWEGEYTIPAGYTTTHMSVANVPEIPAYPQDMYVVAYTSSFGDTPANFNIYNCVKANVGESYTQKGMTSGISAIEADGGNVSAIYYADGMIVVEGGYDTLSVYNMDGRQVGNHALSPGIYVVKAVKGGIVTTKKISVR